MTDLLYREEAYSIVGICMDVYNSLGYGFLEIVYKDAMEIEFIEKKNGTYPGERISNFIQREKIETNILY